MNDDPRASPGGSPPEGFLPAAARGPFTSHNGPLFYRPGTVGAEHAFLVQRRHCNGLGLVHGGMLAAFLDGLLAAAAAAESHLAPITVQLSVSFLGMGRAGGWVIGEARTTRIAREIAFVEGGARMAGRDLARASGVFKLMRRPLA